MSESKEDIQKILQTIKYSLETSDSSLLGKNLALLAEVQPNKWLTLLYFNNILPEPDNKNFKDVVLFLIKGRCVKLKGVAFWSTI